jgi:GNAT superfamily N-acetyltransferase
MTEMSPDRLVQVLDATWAPAEIIWSGPWALRRGLGGGKRVSAATATEPVTQAQISQATEAMKSLNQDPLFMVRAGDDDLDEQLSDLRYKIIDPVKLYSIEIEGMSVPEITPVSAIDTQEPLAIMREVWDNNQTPASRLDVMKRVAVPKVYVLGRHQDKAVGAAFAAIHDGTAMLHALAVNEAARSSGVAKNIIYKSITWAKSQGAAELAVVTTTANGPARSLFASIGMTCADAYHYRALKGSE